MWGAGVAVSGALHELLPAPSPALLGTLVFAQSHPTGMVCSMGRLVEPAVKLCVRACICLPPTSCVVIYSLGSADYQPGELTRNGKVSRGTRAGKAAGGECPVLAEGGHTVVRHPLPKPVG